MAKLEIGDSVMTTMDAAPGKINCAPVKVIKLLGEGGQGWVYLAEYKGEKKALKWYKNCGNDPQAFYQNLKKNVKKGSPNKSFLWPEAITEQTNGSFGYVMDLRPEGYYELSEFMLAKVCFSSFKAEVDACLKIAMAFRILHKNGYAYQDLNDGNFFVNPKNGDVLICDNDNVAEDGVHTGIVGKPRYMAPEITISHCKTMPDTQTDRFSLSIILFIVLCLGHPLEGKLFASANPAMADAVYGEKATFIYDPQDSTNRPIPEATNVLKRWDFLPEYVKNAFRETFGKGENGGMFNRDRRYTELQWMKVFVRFRSEMVECSCGNTVFIKNATSTKCDNPRCGRIINIAHTIQLPEYDMAAVNGARVYRCQLGSCNADEGLNPVASIVAKNDDPGVLGYRNMTELYLDATTPTGRAKKIEPKSVIPFNTGISVDIYGKKILFK